MKKKLSGTEPAEVKKKMSGTEPTDMKKKMSGTVVKRPRQFDIAVKSLYMQSLTSADISIGTGSSHQPEPEQINEIEEEEEEEPEQPAPYQRAPSVMSSNASNPEQGLNYYINKLALLKPQGDGKLVENESLGFRGRGRPYIPQEVLDQPLRRPASTAPQVTSPANDPAFAEFNDVFSGLVDDFTIYNKMERYIFKQARGLADLEKMMKFISCKVLESTKNAATMCKYLYVFSQDPSVRENLQTAFFGNLEKEFMGREEMKIREGPERYRNFIRWIMAVAHHFRNPLYAPFDELIMGLNSLAQEISSFNQPEDYSLFVMLNLRFYYYASLPCSNGKSVPALLGEQYSNAVKSARDIARDRLMRGNLNCEQSNWLMLQLEVTRSSPEIDEDIVDHYKDILPGFSALLPSALTIKLPPNSGREKYLTHIRRFIKS